MNDGTFMAMLAGPSLVLVSWLVPFVTRAAARGDMGPNAAVGIRFPSTTRSPQAWVAAHEAALDPSRWLGRAGLASGALLTLSALLPQGGQPHVVTVILFVLGYAVILLGGVVWCSVVAIRAARESSD